MKDTLRQLPNGDALVASFSAVDGPFIRRREESELVWERPGQPDTVLATSPAIQRAPAYYEACSTAQVHLSPDGNRAWLTKDGKVLASFDRQAATASFDEHHQPEWAKP